MAHRLRDIKAILEFGRREGLAELILEEEGLKIRAIYSPAYVLREDSGEENYAKIITPVSGIFYRTPAPNERPYVEAGERIEVGQTVCIIEAFKAFSQLTSECEGRIVKILAENEQEVKENQVLFLIDTG